MVNVDVNEIALAKKESASIAKSKRTLGQNIYSTVWKVRALHSMNSKYLG
jgi:hypothetical protein